MFKGKKQSYGTAYWYLNGRKMTFRRYLAKYYPVYDWKLMKIFFMDNPIQTKVILDDFSRSNYAKQERTIELITHGKSKIIYIVGGRGMGKTCTAFWLVEEIHKINERFPIYVVGEGVLRTYPKWVRYSDRIEDVPNGSFIILDEASIRYSAREFFKEANIRLGKILAIARHKEMSVVFITQHIGLIDINITRLRDMVLWKKMNDYTFGERSDRGKQGKAQQFWNKVRMNMAPREKDEVLFEYPAERRFIHFQHEPPAFWTEQMSTVFKRYKFDEIKEEKKTKKKILNF